MDFWGSLEQQISNLLKNKHNRHSRQTIIFIAINIYSNNAMDSTDFIY